MYSQSVCFSWKALVLVNAGSNRDILGDFPDGAVLPIQGPRVRSLVGELDLGVGVVWVVCVGELDLGCVCVCLSRV